MDEWGGGGGWRETRELFVQAGDGGVIWLAAPTKKKKASMGIDLMTYSMSKVFWSYLIQSSGKTTFENISKEKAEGDWETFCQSRTSGSAV